MRRILVTGGSRGIGKAIVKMALEDGYEVHTCATDPEALEALQDECGSPDLHTHVLDLADPVAIGEFTSQFPEPLYAIVNNAGIHATEYLHEDKPGTWERIIAINLTAPMLLVKGLVNKLQDHGRIVNISSQLGVEGRAGNGAYCASKHGLNGLTSTWAYELGPRGITCNSICPGWVATEMSVQDTKRIAKLKGMSYEAYYAQICAQLELKRFIAPEEVAGEVLFLLSERASGTTGRNRLMNVVWNETDQS